MTYSFTVDDPSSLESFQLSTYLDIVGTSRASIYFSDDGKEFKRVTTISASKKEHHVDISGRIKGLRVFYLKVELFTPWQAERYVDSLETAYIISLNFKASFNGKGESFIE